ncbi:replication terminator protein [Sporosarcina sp. FSL K6-5500]|uniref:replication terminator protein n=1 Tax=Sporosarcina sp. FSL K6-5500 TaxID=2921558 RepID=UPI0030F8EB59
MKNIVDLNSFANGALAEKVNIELLKVLENIADPNTDPKKSRKVTVNITLKSNENRSLADVQIEAKCTIAPAKAIETAMIIDFGTDGKVTGAELKSGAPGQMYVDGNGEILDDRGEKPEEESSKSSDKVVAFK